MELNIIKMETIICARDATQGKETNISNTEQALSRDAIDKDYYFKVGQLIPGFPFLEFSASSGKLKDDTDVDTTSYHTVTQRFLDLFKSLPIEIRTNIFVHIPTKRGASDDNLHSEEHGTSPHLMLDYTHIEKATVFAPVKYCSRVSQDRSTDGEVELPYDTANKIGQDEAFWKFLQYPFKNLETDEDFASIFSFICDRSKESDLGISYTENDYPLDSSFARSHIDFILFARTLAHSEGFFFEMCPNRRNQGIWKSENRQSSLLREFLGWFWKQFVLDLTNDLDATMTWLETNYLQFHCLQEIVIEILASPYIATEDEWIKGSLDSQKLKTLLKELEKLPNIEHLQVILQIERRDLKRVLHSPGAYRWVNTLRGVKFAKHFSVSCLLWDCCADEEFEEFLVNESERKKIERNRRLNQLLRPDILCHGTTDDLPDHLGLRQLFAMEEE